MERFSLENFRKFDSFPPITFGGVTFLIGENNAGKSSIVKSIILSQQNLQPLFTYNGDESLHPMFAFDVEQLHIGTYERAVCNQCNNEYFSFHIDERLGFSYTFAIARPKTGSDHTQAPIAYIELVWGEERCSIRFDFEARKIIAKADSRTEAQIEELKKKISERKSIIDHGVSVIQKRHMETIVSDMQKIVDNPLGGEVCIDMPQKMEELEGVRYYPAVIPYLFAYTFGHYPYAGKSNETKNFLANYTYAFKTPGLLYDSDYFSNAYIYSHGASQNVLYRYEDKNDYTAQSVHNYMKEGIKKGSKADQFVTTWMRNFKIGKEFTITSIYGDSYTLVITDYSGKKMPLADKGIGSIQIMSLLLRLAVLIKKGNGEGKIVLIEEPEQNLHPTLQGQLAKLLYEINTTYGYQVIVETHSEYLVRMSQVLVSQISQDNGCKTKEELDRYNPFKIHYLPSNAPHYEIKYQINGTLDRPFGTGFYDVADELAMSLML